MPVSPLRSCDPTTLGPYQLLGRVASGGMGVVYLGRENGRPDSLVAVKTVRPDPAPPADVVMRLRHESRVTADLARDAPPGGALARFVGAGDEAGTPWIATEYVPGVPLHEAAHGVGLSHPDVTDLAETLAGGIAWLHRSGYAHRDVKPANVVLGPDGARLVDLGLAQRLGEPRGSMPMGSPGWSPPEQRDPSGDPRPGDVHGWAMTVAYAAAGRPPFGTGPGALVTRRMLTGRPRLTGLAPTLREIVAAALRADPTSRPTACEVVAALAAQPHVVASSHVGALGASAVPAPSTQELAAPTLVEESDAPRSRRSVDSAVGLRDPRLVAVAACSLLVLGGIALGTDVTNGSARAIGPPASVRSPSATSVPTPTPAVTRPTPTPPRVAPVARRTVVAPVPARHGKGKGKHHGHQR